MENHPVNSGPRSSGAFARGAKKTLVLVLLVVLLIGAATLAFLQFASYSEGFRVGTIQKISKKGFLLKTYEGELTQGMIETNVDPASGGGTGVSTRIWYFSAEKSEPLLQAMDHAIETNKRVKLFYHERYARLPWVGESAYVVYKVEELQ